MKPSSLGYMQRLVASNKFHGAVEERFDTIIIVEKVLGRSSLSVENLYSCWIAMKLCFVRIPTSPEDSSLC